MSWVRPPLPTPIFQLLSVTFLLFPCRSKPGLPLCRLPAPTHPSPRHHRYSWSCGCPRGADWPNKAKRFNYDFNMNWQWIVTTSIAAYAAVLSTYNVITSRKKETHQITVTVGHGFVPVGPDLGDEMMMIEAANHGHRSVTVTSAGLLLPDRRQLFYLASAGTVPLPYHLNEGTSCKQWMPLTVIQEELRKSGFSGKVKVRGFYLDALNNRHLSEPAEVDLHRSQ
jgi:hypothetical protein